MIYWPAIRAAIRKRKQAKRANESRKPGNREEKSETQRSVSPPRSKPRS